MEVPDSFLPPPLRVIYGKNIKWKKIKNCGNLSSSCIPTPPSFEILLYLVILILLTPFLSSFWCQWSYDSLVPLQREAQQRQHGGAYRQVTAGHEERQS